MLMSASKEEGRLIGAVMVEIDLVGQPWAAAFYCLVSSPHPLVAVQPKSCCCSEKWDCHTAGNGKWVGGALDKASIWTHTHTQPPTVKFLMKTIIKLHVAHVPMHVFTNLLHRPFVCVYEAVFTETPATHTISSWMHAWDGSPHLPATPAQLMRPSIGWNASRAMGNFCTSI